MDTKTEQHASVSATNGATSSGESKDSTSIDAMPEKQHEFHIEEYRWICKDIELRLLELKHVETFGIGGLFIIAAWLLSNVAKDSWFWAALPIFTVCCGLRALAIYIHFRRIATYLRRVEQKYFGKCGGWNESYWRNRFQSFLIAHAVGWLIVLALSIGLWIWH